MTFSFDIMSCLIGAGASFAIAFALFRKNNSGLETHLSAKNADLEKQNQDLLQKTARLETALEKEEEALSQHRQDLAEMEKKAALQFENLANRIFDDKSAKFKKDSAEGL